MKRSLIVAAVTAAAALTTGWSAYGDEFGFAPDQPTSEFQFTRLYYTSQGGIDSGYWQVDWDDAEYHLLRGISRLTRIDADPQGRIFSISNDSIFDYPWLYAVEVGYWYLNDAEAARMREYLLRGGFLMVDDFHGSRQWEGFRDSMQRVFPDRPIVDVPVEDEIFHVLYDLNQRTQIYGIRYFYTGRTYEEDGVVPHWRGIYDDDGRLMVAINHNMDLGDAWEHADLPQYPEPLTALAYRFAINYVIYAMTH
jgi:hypothetical protein